MKNLKNFADLFKGLSSEMTLLDIAKKHTSKDTQSFEVKSMYSILKKQIEKGIKVEMEHTKNKEVAKRIAMDHLVETPDYYDKLLKAGL
jgi:hypothetical protein